MENLYSGHKVYFRYITEHGALGPIDHLFIHGESPVSALSQAKATLSLWAQDERWQEYHALHVTPVKNQSEPPYGDLQRVILTDLEQLGYH